MRRRHVGAAVAGLVAVAVAAKPRPARAWDTVIDPVVDSSVMEAVAELSAIAGETRVQNGTLREVLSGLGLSGEMSAFVPAVDVFLEGTTIADEVCRANYRGTMSIQDWMPDFGELTGDFCTDVQTVADGARMVRDLLEPPNGADLRVQRGVMARRVSVARESAYDGLADAMTYLAERQDAPADDSVMRDMAELVRESSGSLREQSAATNALLLAILGEMRTHRRESEVQGNLLAQMVRMTAARGLADEELAGFVRPDTDPGDSWRLDLPGPDGEEPTL